MINVIEVSDQDAIIVQGPASNTREANVVLRQMVEGGLEAGVVPIAFFAKETYDITVLKRKKEPQMALTWTGTATNLSRQIL